MPLAPNMQLCPHACNGISEPEQRTKHASMFALGLDITRKPANLSYLPT